MAAADLLSVLPDDVLQHMLPFKPTRDADTSEWRRKSALRRWRCASILNG
jgi:hypothetical protein